MLKCYLFLEIFPDFLSLIYLFLLCSHIESYAYFYHNIRQIVL